MKIFFFQFFILFFSFFSYAQHQEVDERPEVWKEKKTETDSTSLLAAFRRGNISGHFRYFFMNTDNKEGLTDYYANAIGGGIKFETAKFKNFQFGVSGFFTFNIGSSNLSLPDPSTNQLNRYEIGLFDIEDPLNKKDIDRLEELYLKYNFKKATITLGKQLLNTPFINLQDGRMRPTEVEGIWADIKNIKKTKIEFGYIYGISPRSTVKWYRVDESIGIYPMGVNADGTKADYVGNLKSKGILLAGITFQVIPNLKLQFWNQFTENIFNSALFQANYESSLPDQSIVFAAIQMIRQDAIKDGGNQDAKKAYINAGEKSFSFGGKAGWKNNKWETSINYNRITSKGKYMMPREWGRDPFFTFLPRERNEGFGDVQAVMTKVNYKIPTLRVTTSIAFGYYNLPDVTNYALNKYGLPSYNQLNVDIRYKFSGLLNGLESQLLFGYKNKIGNDFNNNKFVINKVDMSLWNLVLNYQF